MNTRKKHLVLAALGCVMTLPVVLAAFSPYLSFRSPIYIVAGFAGILCLSLFALHPLLATRLLAFNPITSRRMHRILGMTLVGLTGAHVVGLYVTSPPDVIDALLLRAPTLFSVFGVIALWAIVLTAIIASLRRHMPQRHWQITHQTLSSIVVVSTVIHALQIDGAMEHTSKWIIAATALLSTGLALIWLRKSR